MHNSGQPCSQNNHLQYPVPWKAHSYLAEIGTEVNVVFGNVLVHSDRCTTLASLAAKITICNILFLGKHIAILQRLGLNPMLSLGMFWCTVTDAQLWPAL